jgi:hypothetical protein
MASNSSQPYNMKTNNAVGIISKWWNIHTCKKMINSFNLDLPNESFDEYTKTIQNPMVIKISNKFINLIGINGINPRVYLSSFLIYNWKNEIIGDTNNVTEDNDYIKLRKTINERLTIASRKVVETYKSGDIKLHCLYVSIFNRLFAEWKSYDINDLVADMCYNYTELTKCEDFLLQEEAQDEPSNEIIKNYLKLQKENIKKHLESIIGPRSTHEELNRFKAPKLSVSYSQLRDIMKKAFWDKLEEDLKKQPPELRNVLSLLDEIKMKLKMLVPRRKDISDDIESSIDIDHIKNMFEHGAFDHDELLMIINYIGNLIKSFGSPSDDNDTDEWLELMVERCINKDPMYVIIPEFFKIAFNKVESIKNGSEIVKDIILEELKKNPK